MAAILRLRGPPHIGRSRRPGAPDALRADAGRLSAVETRVRPRTMSIESQLPAGLQTPVAERLQAAADEQVVRRLWDRDGTLWAPEGTAGADRPARLAGHRRAAVGRGRRPARVRRPRCATPASPTPCCSAWAARASGPRCFRRSFGDGSDPPARARLHAPGRDPRRRATRSTSARRCSSSRRSPAARSRRCRSSSTSTRCRATARTTSPSPTRAPRSRSSAPSTASGACSRTTPTSAGATPCCPTSGSSRPRSPATTSAPSCATAVEAMEACRREQDNPGLELGAALGELALRGRDKLTFIVDEPLESFGLWAEQLVAESTGKQGRGILPIADEPLVPGRRVRRRPRVRARLHGRRRGHRARSASSAPPGTRSSRSTPTGRPTSAACSSCRSSPPRWPAGRSGSTRSTSPTSRRPRTTPSACSTKARPSSRPATSTRCSARSRPPRYLAIMAYLPYSSAVEAGAARLRERAVRAPPRRDHLRLRPPLPALDRPVPQGRAVGRRLPADRRRAAGGPRGPRRAVHVRHADPRAGRRRPADTALARPGRRAGRKGDPLMQLGFVGPGEDGRQHGPSHPPRLGPPGRRVRLQRGRGQGGRGPRRDRRRLARGARVQARGAADRLGDGPGRRPDRADRQEARRAARRGRHDRRRRQHQLARRRPPRRASSTRSASTTSTSAPPAASGAWRSATA